MRLKFDVTSWYVSYARGQNQNLGLLLISSKAVEVKGDKDYTGAPRIFFEKWVQP